jgi:nitrate/TMAO reductase-like tetraheme cytochrome c subunit
MSYFGGLTAAGSSALIVFAIIGELTIVQPSPYVGIITYLIFPMFLFSGLILVLWGMRREAVRRRRQEAAKELPYPQIDLNDPKQRRRFGYALVSGTVLMLVFAWVGYNGYLFTGSTTFCGKICHTVMEPEYTAYTNSPHARVACVDCHVGEGASWYVQSKISGVRQVFAVALGTYERPIPTPIAHLRPARETCERCHWPQKFFGASLVQIPHYRYDEKNTAEQISLLMRTGGGDPAHGESAGIHWHMVVDNEVTFVATDPRRQDIPWVRVKHADGTMVTYKSKQTKLTDEQLGALPKRVMDCMDCHNRPSHAFPAPEGSVDKEMAGGAIPPDLPWIKKVVVDALGGAYDTRDAAHAGIRASIVGFYQKEYPAIASSRGADLDKAVNMAIGIYDRAVFPEMNVDWKTYPNNIGHRHWPGCFRCHDDEHLAEDGKPLSKSCTLCHTAPQRGPRVPLGEVMPSSASGESWHPWALPGTSVTIEAHDRLLCHQCHAAGFRPRSACTDCHN